MIRRSLITGERRNWLRFARGPSVTIDGGVGGQLAGPLGASQFAHRKATRSHISRTRQSLLSQRREHAANASSLAAIEPNSDQNHAGVLVSRKGH